MVYCVFSYLPAWIFPHTVLINHTVYLCHYVIMSSCNYVIIMHCMAWRRKINFLSFFLLQSFPYSYYYCVKAVSLLLLLFELLRYNKVNIKKVQIFFILLSFLFVSVCFGWSSVCFGSIETPKLAVSVLKQNNRNKRFVSDSAETSFGSSFGCFESKLVSKDTLIPSYFSSIICNFITASLWGGSDFVGFIFRIGLGSQENYHYFFHSIRGLSC